MEHIGKMIVNNLSVRNPDGKPTIEDFVLTCVDENGKCEWKKIDSFRVFSYKLDPDSDNIWVRKTPTSAYDNTVTTFIDDEVKTVTTGFKIGDLIIVEDPDDEYTIYMCKFAGHAHAQWEEIKQRHIIQDSGTPLPDYPILNFGNNITVTEDEPYNRLTLSVTGLGEVNDGENLGSTGDGSGIFYDKDGLNLRFRRIIAGTDISIVEATDAPYNITINSTSDGEANTASNLGTGGKVYEDKVGVQFRFRSLIGGDRCTVVENTNDLTINVDSFPDVVGQNLGSTSDNQGIYVDKTGDTLQFKSLVGGTGISLSSSADEITITNDSPGEVNVGQNLGSTSDNQGIYVDKTGDTLQFKSLVGGTGISLSSSDDEITITNDSSGVFVVAMGNQIQPDTDYVGHSFRLDPSESTGSFFNFIPNDGILMIGKNLDYVSDTKDVFLRGDGTCGFGTSSFSEANWKNAPTDYGTSLNQYMRFHNVRGYTGSGSGLNIDVRREVLTIPLPGNRFQYNPGGGFLHAGQFFRLNIHLFSEFIVGSDNYYFYSYKECVFSMKNEEIRLLSNDTINQRNIGARRHSGIIFPSDLTQDIDFDNMTSYKIPQNELVITGHFDGSLVSTTNPEEIVYSCFAELFIIPMSYSETDPG